MTIYRLLLVYHVTCGQDMASTAAYAKAEKDMMDCMVCEEAVQPVYHITICGMVLGADKRYDSHSSTDIDHH